MSKASKLNLKEIESAVAGNAVAFRSSIRLLPAGGPGDKVFPPTYATGDRKLKYAIEERRVDGESVKTVLLDSVQSQANRMEEALQEGWDSAELSFPLITVDFRQEKSIEDLDRITSLQAPHRIADALLRDSVSEDGTLFRDTEAGKAFTASSPRNATAVFRYCPTALVFGVWDSTGPRGGMGSKFQRVLVSEIVGFGAETGTKSASRIDPAGIQANVPIYHHKDDHDDWTIKEDEAELKKKKPVAFSRKGTEGKGKPSAINHSNVAPTLDDHAGGVTIDYAMQSTVLSLPAIRRLRFLQDINGLTLDGDSRRDAELAAHVALVSLGLAAMTYQRAYGYDLRSRCLLVPDSSNPHELEILSAHGETRRFLLETDDARKILEEAGTKAGSVGLGWEREPLTLKPAPKLADLIRRSRELAAEHVAEAE